MSRATMELIRIPARATVIRAVETGLLAGALALFWRELGPAGRSVLPLVYLGQFVVLGLVEAGRRLTSKNADTIGVSGKGLPHGVVLAASVAALFANAYLAVAPVLVLLPALAFVWPQAGRMMATAALFLCGFAFASDGIVMESDFIAPKHADRELYPARFSTAAQIGLVAASGVLAPILAALWLGVAARFGRLARAMLRSAG